MICGITGAHHGRFFLDQLDRELARSRRRGGTFSVILFDVAELPTLLSTKGRGVVDALLALICRRLRRRVRREDVLARLDDGAFAVLLTGADPAGAGAFVGSMCDLVGGAPFEVGGAKLRVTLELGVAAPEIPQGDSTDSLLDRARAALAAARSTPRAVLNTPA